MGCSSSKSITVYDLDSIILTNQKSSKLQYSRSITRPSQKIRLLKPIPEELSFLELSSGA